MVITYSFLRVYMKAFGVKVNFQSKGIIGIGKYIDGFD